jgi:preprotein translocase subunit YajC
MLVFPVSADAKVQAVRLSNQRSAVVCSLAVRAFAVAVVAMLVLCATERNLVAQATSVGTAAQSSIEKAVGTIKSVQADSITVAAESGSEVTAKLAPSTKILRIAPGEKDLKKATPLQPQDLQPGDRVLVRGQVTGDAHTMAALAVIVMKESDVSARQQQEREDWQKRGVGGLVSKVDAAAGTILISSGGFGANKTITIHVEKNTILRRYAPDSVKFDEAKVAPLDQIRAGDQLRARGAPSADGSELTAEEVVSGTFRNIAGTITGVDAANNAMTVKDAIGKNSVTVKVSSDSQMKKLPPEMAQRIAMRLKAASGSGEQPGGAAQNAGGSGSGAAGAGRELEANGNRGQGGGAGGNGAPDIQRFLSRLPNSSLADLQKGDEVMIVSTEGGDSGTVTAITLLAGVDPILTASPKATSLLSPWSLNPSGGGEGDSAP